MHLYEDYKLIVDIIKAEDIDISKENIGRIAYLIWEKHYYMLKSYEKMFKGMRTFELEEILADMDEAGVDKAVIVAIDAETVYHYKVPNELVANAVKKYPDRFIGFASVDPHKGVLAIDELKRSVEELGLNGLKIIPHLIEMPPNDKRMYPILEKAQELKAALKRALEKLRSRGYAPRGLKP